MSRTIPRSVNIRYVPNYSTGGTHNVLEVCDSHSGVRFVMAQDEETAKERDQYKLRAHLQAERIEELQAKLKDTVKTAYFKGHEDTVEGDWYCRNCGYLDGSRVTYSETCDECHTPVVVHTAEEQHRIAELESDNARLREAVRTAYFKGHEDTVEGCFAWCDEGSQDVADELIAAALEGKL